MIAQSGEDIRHMAFIHTSSSFLYMDEPPVPMRGGSSISHGAAGEARRQTFVATFTLSGHSVVLDGWLTRRLDLAEWVLQRQCRLATVIERTADREGQASADRPR
jgi:hypothetical protein